MTTKNNPQDEKEINKDISLAMSVRNVEENLHYNPSATYFTKDETDKFLIWAYNQGASDINIYCNLPYKF